MTDFLIGLLILLGGSFTVFIFILSLIERNKNNYGILGIRNERNDKMTEQKARMVITNYASKMIKEARENGNTDKIQDLIEAVDLITGKYSMALQARSITDIHFGSVKSITANHIGDTFEHY